MNEYKIHQRFFAKLKQKAEKKRNEMETQNKQEEQVITQTEKLRSSPERPPRKRPVPAPGDKPAVKTPKAVEESGADRVSLEVKEKTPVASTELEKETEKSLAKKKIKISNGVDVPVSSSNSSSRGHVIGNGGENCYDGGMSLAQFLAEALQSQAAEEKQSSPRGERHKEMEVSTEGASTEKDREQERMQKEEEEEKEKLLEEERKKEKRKEEELERERSLHTVSYTKHSSDVKHHNKAHKDHDHHKIQASISSMFHSVKDFLFGKNKRDSHDHIENRERESDHLPPPPETPPSFRLREELNQECKPPTEDTLPVDICKPKQTPETVSLGPHEHKPDASAPHTELPPPESVGASTGLSVNRADDAEEAMEVSVGPEISSPGSDVSLNGLQLLSEVWAVVVQSIWLTPYGYI